MSKMTAEFPIMTRWLPISLLAMLLVACGEAENSPPENVETIEQGSVQSGEAESNPASVPADGSRVDRSDAPTTSNDVFTIDDGGITLIGTSLSRNGILNQLVDFDEAEMKGGPIIDQPVDINVEAGTMGEVLGQLLDGVNYQARFEKQPGARMRHWGAESPVFHIPGRKKDYYECELINDDTGTGSTTEYLEISVIGAIPPECTSGYVEYDITISHPTLADQNYTGIITPDTSPIEILLTDSGWTISAQTYNTVDPLSQCGDMEGFAQIDSGNSGSGNPPADYDSKPITTWSLDLQFLGLNSQQDLDSYIAENGALETWQVYNTARKLAGNLGIPGYYECQNATYNNGDIECVDDYWGVDCCGFPLDGEKVRHHRMPDRTLEPLQEDHSSGTRVRKIGLQFDNIEYPDETIIGHYFVIRKRTVNTRTIEDKGVLGAVRTGSQGEVFCNMDSDNDTPWNYLWTPKNMTGDQSDADYIKAESLRENTYRMNGDDYEEEYNDALLTGKDFYIGTRVLRYETEGTPNWTNYNIVEQRVLQHGEQQTQLAGDNLTNLSFSNFVEFVKTPASLNTTRDQLHYVSLKKYRPNIYCDLFSGEYVKLHPCMKTINEEDGYYTFGGDTFITEFRVGNAMLKRVKEGIWDDILIVFAIVVGTALTVLTAGIGAVGVAAGISAIITAGISTAVGIGAVIAGAIGVSRQIILATGEAIRDGVYEAYLGNDYGDFNPNAEAGTSYQFYAAEFLDRWYIESDTNYAFARNQERFCVRYSTA